MKLNSLIWLTWRQHRWAIAGVAALGLLAAYTLISIEADGVPGGLESMPLGGFYGLMVQLGFGGVIGMFWGAPLIARELEERTYFVAWGQDVTPVQWLRGKLIVFGLLAVLLGAIVGIGDGYIGTTRSWSSFEANPLVQAGYAVLGLAVGVLVGLLTRHVMTAIAGTLVFFMLVRVLVSVAVRDYYLPPERIIVRWESTPVVPSRGLELGNGFIGADLEPATVSDACFQAINVNTCMRNTKAAIGTYVDYQPIERLTAFQIIEFVLCALLAAVLFVVIFRLMRRGGGWKPSRSHRRLGSPVPELAASDSEPVASDSEAVPEPEPDPEPAQDDQSAPETAAAKTEG